MKRLVIYIFLAFVISLAGCSSTKEELKKGVSLYEKGTLEDTIEAREFFIDYLSKNPGNDDAEDWLSKVEKDLKKLLKKEIEKLYAEKDFEPALEYTELLVEIESDDEALAALDMIKGAYEEQMEFDRFNNFITKKYNELYEIFAYWRSNLEYAVLNGNDINSLDKTATEILPKISTIREEIQQENLAITNQTYLDAQSELFNYVNRIEEQLTEVIIHKPEEVDRYDRVLIDLSPEQFNNVFVHIQQSVNEYLTEVDREGNNIRHIDGTLNFHQPVEIDENLQDNIEEELNNGEFSLEEFQKMLQGFSDNEEKENNGSEEENSEEKSN